jgi:beta-galactosidase
VNWARFNPAPLPGMVRAWTWEAFAHGAETVSYFRWRQAPFAQEQMHAGLNRSDREVDVGGREARVVADELKTIGELGPCGRAPVALVFSYEAVWHLRIQPQGAGFAWIVLAHQAYAALRRLGLDVDIVPPGGDFGGYNLVLCPSLPILDHDTLDQLSLSGAHVLFGPRTGSRTRDGATPEHLPPGPLQVRLPLKVTRVQSLRPGAGVGVVLGDKTLPARLWRETLETTLEPLATFDDGGPAWVGDGRWSYLATWPEQPLMDAIVERLAREAGLFVAHLEEGVRMRTRDGVAFAFNYAAEARRTPAPAGARFLLGGPELQPAGVSAWRIE